MRQAIVDLLLTEPRLLLLFVVSALGYVLGRVSIFGFRLGIAAVLFVGLAIGSIDPQMELPEYVHLLGLCLFVYTIGLSSGQHFFSAFKRKGLRDNLLMLGALGLASLTTVLCQAVFRLGSPVTAGVFCGSLTNTPALAAVMETLKRGGETSMALQAEPVVGYSISYPIGVIGMIAAVALARRFWKVDDMAEATEAAKSGIGASGGRLSSRSVLVSNPLIVGMSPDEVQEHAGINVVFGRLKRGNQTTLATSVPHFLLGDLVTIVGTADQIDLMIDVLGQQSEERIELDRKDFDYRRVFVSNPRVIGHTLEELDLPQHFGAVITRLRRGDVEIVPRDHTVLEIGDQVRILTRPDLGDAVTKYLGDSYREVSEIDILGMGLGIAIGLLLGMLPIPLPGGVVVKLGLAGGPLVAALILGTLRRTGPIIWTIPYGANVTLRQFGLILFLAGVGTRSGHEFAATLRQGSGLTLVVTAMAITTVASLAMLIVGHRVFRIPLGQATGMLAGLQTQPALLAYSLEQSRNELPNIGYATVYPMAMIAKILMAQLLLAF